MEDINELENKFKTREDRIYDSVVKMVNNENEKKLAVEALKFINGIIKNVSVVFDKSVNLDVVSKAIYDSLMMEHYSNQDILDNNCSEKIVEYITNNNFGIKYNKEFTEIYDFIRNRAVAVFKYKNSQKELLEDYDSWKTENKIAFSVAFNVYLKEENVKKLYQTGKLDKLLENRIIVDTSNKKSISKKNDTIVRRNQYRNVAIDYDKLKKIIIYIILFFGLNSLFSSKPENKNETKNVPNRVEYTQMQIEDENNVDRIIQAMQKANSPQNFTMGGK